MSSGPRQRPGGRAPIPPESHPRSTSAIWSLAVTAVVAALLAVIPTVGGGPDYSAMVPPAPPPVVVPAVMIEGEAVEPTLDLWWYLCIHRYEASGWHNHRDGGLQIIPSTWKSQGGREFAPDAGDATITQQLEVGRRVLTSGGETQWTTWRRCS